MPSHIDIELAESLASVTIAASASVSNPVYLGQRSIATIGMPATWTAAVLTFQASFDGTNWQNVYVGGAEYSETVVADTAQPPASAYLQFPYVRIRSGTTLTPVTQAAARTINLMLRRFVVK